MGKNKTANIIHHGAINGVTGSCHELVLADKSSILIDCGLFQGGEAAADNNNSETLEINFAVSQIRALIVTHVHIDHVGRIPYLLAAGFNGPIYCSQVSALLLPVVLDDALKFSFTHSSQILDKFEQKIKKIIVPLKYNQWVRISPNQSNSAADPSPLKIKLSPAGHILGSAFVQCLLGTGKNVNRIVFSGDLGAPYTPLLPAPRSPYRCDVMVLESTYGDKKHPPRHQRVEKLAEVIKHALDNNGTILIPAFSIGRTQELLYEIEQLIYSHKNQLIKKGLKWQDLEVIIDSPLAAKFTRLYRQLKSFWDKEAKIRIKQGRHPLSFEQLLIIDDHKTHLQTVNYLAKSHRPAIVIAASGMCSGGRVVNYLKALLANPVNDVLFVGYQASGTPGRQIQKYGPRGGYVELDGKRYDIGAQIHTIGAYSAHADQSDLIRFIKRIRHKPREIRLVHGNQEAKASLKEQLYLQLTYKPDIVI
jgi:metallo-beta-lactamase family protein